MIQIIKDIALVTGGIIIGLIISYVYTYNDAYKNWEKKMVVLTREEFDKEYESVMVDDSVGIHDVFFEVAKRLIHKRQEK